MRKIIVVLIGLLILTGCEGESKSAKKFNPVYRDCGSSNYTGQANPKQVVRQCQNANWMNLVGLEFTAKPDIFGVFHDEERPMSSKGFGVINPERFSIERVEFLPSNYNDKYIVMLGVKFQSGKKANLYVEASDGNSLAHTLGLHTTCEELADIVSGINYHYCLCK